MHEGVNEVTISKNTSKILMDIKKKWAKIKDIFVNFEYRID